jgi:F420-dependent methylenetetrahydromethanopterin dehydrogenase
MKTSERPRATSQQKIATLLELIKDPKATRQEIVVRCRRAGIGIKPKVVDVVFDQYELDKKRAL